MNQWWIRKLEFGFRTLVPFPAISQTVIKIRFANITQKMKNLSLTINQKSLFRFRIPFFSSRIFFPSNHTKKKKIIDGVHFTYVFHRREPCEQAFPCRRSDKPWLWKLRETISRCRNQKTTNRDRGSSRRSSPSSIQRGKELNPRGRPFASPLQEAQLSENPRTLRFATREERLRPRPNSHLNFVTALCGETK